MVNLERRHTLPDLERVSVLAAMIFLAYTLTHFVDFPELAFAVQLPGIYLNIPINIDNLTALIVAGLMAAGADWLLRDHPALRDRSPFPHWILPSLTALVIGIPLNQLPYNLLWWSGLFAGGLLLVFVLIGEYIALDSQDIRQPLASAGLSAVAYTLFLILASALRAANFRLFYVLPILMVAVWMVCVRAMHLRLHGEWTVYEAGIIALIIGQMAAGLHYWPMAPIPFGLAVLGPAYALTSLFSALIEERPFKQALVEPVLAVLFAWGAAIWMS